MGMTILWHRAQPVGVDVAKDGAKDVGCRKPQTLAGGHCHLKRG
jgi:hypothetical protein